MSDTFENDAPALGDEQPKNPTVDPSPIKASTIQLVTVIAVNVVGVLVALKFLTPEQGQNATGAIGESLGAAAVVVGNVWAFVGWLKHQREKSNDEIRRTMLAYSVIDSSKQKDKAEVFRAIWKG